jgi:lysozyme family protein
MADFNKYFPSYLKHEGGYVNNPSDRGGETYRGIARNSNPSWSGWAFIDNKKKSGAIKFNTVYPELESAVKSLIKSKYWDTMALDSMNNQDIANILADFKVNGMTKTAQQRIQSFVGANPDGAIGSKTVASINAYKEPRKLFDFIYEIRKAHYENLAKNPSQQQFLKGWMNRINYIRDSAGQFIRENPKTSIAIGSVLAISIVAVSAYVIYKQLKK